MELLISFLRYISNKDPIRSSYLEILHTILRTENMSWERMVYPPFTEYNEIEKISFVMNDFRLSNHHSANERKRIYGEMKDYFDKGHVYKDRSHLTNSEEKNQINYLLKTTQLNLKLRTFVMTIDELISSMNIVRIAIYMYII